MTLWIQARDEITEWREKYVGERPLYIVPDSDIWNSNVLLNALTAAEAFGGYVAVPPAEGMKKSGYDDFALQGGTVGQLMVITIKVPAAFDDTAALALHRLRDRDARQNATKVLRWLVLHAAANKSRVAVKGKTIARSTGLSKDTVNRCLREYLHEAGLVRLVQPAVRRRRPSWLKTGGWQNVPPVYKVESVPWLTPSYTFTPLDDHRD